MRASTRRVLPLVFLLAAAGCGGGSEGPAGASARPAPAKKPVAVARAERRSMERLVLVSGSLFAKESSTLSAKTAGRLQSIGVDVGSVVGAGEVLAQVEPRDYELRVAQARAALAQARAALGLDLEGSEPAVDVDQLSTVRQARAVYEEASKSRDRIRSLFQSGVASDADVDTADAAFTVARSRFESAQDEARTRLAALQQRRAELEIAEKQLADTAVRAPFAGVVQSRPASPGEYVTSGTAIVTLVEADPLRLRIDVSERDSSFVAVGQLVRVRVEGDETVHEGRVARIAPALDSASRVLRVEADVPAGGTLRPGRFVRAEIVVGEDANGLGVPMAALVTFAGIEKVVAVENGRAREVVVRTGRRGSDWVEIASGLGEGAQVVLDPEGLHTGDLLSVAADASPADSAGSTP